MNSPQVNESAILDFPRSTLMDIQEDTFQWFWDSATKANNYLTLDRSSDVITEADTMSSIAATGFALTVYAVGVERQYITREQAVERTLHVLKTLFEAKQGPDTQNCSGYKGFFYH